MAPSARMPAPLLAALGLATLAVAASSDVLFAAGDMVLSSREADTFFYFVRVRHFAAEQILQGNIPLWNPHIYAGTPFLGSYQSTLFYPFNATYLLLPLATALNLEMVLHVFLMGLFTYAWVRGRGVHDAAAFFSGATMMLCGAVSVRVLAGQLTVLTAACWTPAVLLAAERLLARPTLGWTLAGIAAITLQILAGYPLYVFISALLVGATVLLNLRRCEDLWRSTLALACLAAAPLLLSAVQLFTGLETASESLRSGGVPFWFAASFSLPPENLLTTIAPAFFGDTPNTIYWGKSRYWDMAAFLGVTTVVLAVFGAVRGDRTQRRFAAGFALVMLVVALGQNTPLYRLLYDWVPGFDQFRAPSKFTLLASLFVALLAGVGLDRLLRGSSGARGAALGAACLALVLGGLGLWISVEATVPGGGLWEEATRAWSQPGRVPDQVSLADAGRGASSALWIAAGTAAAVALLLWLRTRRRWAATAILVLGVAEVLIFAHRHHDGFDLEETRRHSLEAFYRENPGDYRVLDPIGRNHAMDVGAWSVWGYEPVQLRRYGRFAASIRSAIKFGGIPKNTLKIPIQPRMDAYHRLLRLVRCRFVIEDWELDGQPRETYDPLPRFLLMGRYEVLGGQAVLRSMFRTDFSPRRQVLLEEHPQPRPTQRGAEGRVVLVDESTDHLTVDVELPAPAVLLMTDSYSRGWRATAISEEPPRELRILPANYMLRAIALPEGRHRLRLEYAPTSYRLGSLVSLASLVTYLAVVAHWIRLRRAAAGTDGPGPRGAASPSAEDLC